MNEKNYVHLLCIQCKKIYTKKVGFNFAFGYALIFISIYFFGNALFEDGLDITLTLVLLMVYVMMFVVGVILVRDSNKERQDCPVCKGYNTLIKIDTPVAIDVIKKYDIPFPEEPESLDSSVFKKFPWEKN